MLTHCWRRQSRANSSLKVEVVAPGGSRQIPRRFWTITEGEKGYFGLEYARILVFPLASFSCYLDVKPLKARRF
jgi:hypothetical protein